MSGKKNRKRKQKIKRLAKIKLGKIVRFNLANSNKKYNGYSNKYSYQTNIHNIIYKDGQFCNVKYQASNITHCNFKNTKLNGVDFYNTNLKRTSFKGASLNHVVFFNCNLKDADFENASFHDVYFICTNTKTAKQLCLDQECVELKTYPNIQLDEPTKNMIMQLSNNNKLYKSHVLHVTKEKINMWTIRVLLDYAGNDLYRCLYVLNRRKDKRNFYTVYSYKKFIDNYLRR